jgi:acetyltransferase-like isoleucine patch superfamily enzyme
MPAMILRKVRTLWARFWLSRAGLSPLGRVWARIAMAGTPPYKARHYLAAMTRRGFVSPRATIYHKDLRLGPHIFIGDGVTIFQGTGGGRVTVDEAACVWGNSHIETGEGGSITIGPESRINRGVSLISYISPIQIGRDVGIGENSIFYSFNHGIASGVPYLEQALETRGPIIVDDYAWVGAGSIVLDGVRIGKGAVVGAGSVVTRDIPDGAIALGVPAQVVRMRGEASRYGAEGDAEKQNGLAGIRHDATHTGSKPPE